MTLRRWDEIYQPTPERRERVEAEKRAVMRRYNRPWWRLVRVWDRLTRG